MNRFISGLIFFTILFSSDLFSVDTVSTALSGYKPVYFILGDLKNEVKIQVSFKYDFFFPWKLGLYGAYTQDMFWDLFKDSNPFKTIDYNPDFFWRFESGNNFADDLNTGFLDYIQLGLFEHKSNGSDGTNSRGWSRSYLQAQISAGDFLNFGLNAKYFYLYLTGDNPNIANYIGSFETKVFLKLRDPDLKIDYEELYASFGAGGGMNGFDFSKGWQEYGLKIRLLFSRIRPYLQVWNGYGENILDYNQRSEMKIRAGIILE